MKFQNTFDIEEFLAYLLPGFLLLATFILNDPARLDKVISTTTEERAEFLTGFILSIQFVTISVLLGHASSVVARHVVRPMMNRLLGDPEECLTRGATPFGLATVFTPEIKAIIRKQFEQRFGLESMSPNVQKSVPRLIRNYVFQNAERVELLRQKIVRQRAICANMIPPLILILVWRPLNIDGNAILWIVAILGLLIAKQRDLDIRETKEIYLNFLALNAHQGSPKNTPQQ